MASPPNSPESLAAPAYATLDVAARARRATPAENAASWAAQKLEAGSRVLQDQFTPSLDPERFRVYRLRVEEKRFVGNYDYVFTTDPRYFSLTRLRFSIDKAFPHRGSNRLFDYQNL